MISVYDHDAYALVDPRATHSFIAVPFTERHQIESQPIDGRMVVFVPNGDTMISERIVPGSRLVIQNKDFCDAPDPAPEVDVEQGCHTLRDCGSLTFNLFFFRADTCIHMHNFCNNKNSFFLHIHYTRVPFTCTITIHYYKTIHIKSEIAKQCSEHLSLRWHVLLMWDVLSSILVFCFCTYTD